MNIVNCSECGRVCVDTPSKRCPNCRQLILQYEERVLVYMDCQYTSTLDTIRTETDVPRHIIMQMIKDGRLKTNSVSYPCECCRAPITKGRLCPRCADNFSLEPGAKISGDPTPFTKSFPQMLYRDTTGSGLPFPSPRSLAQALSKGGFE